MGDIYNERIKLFKDTVAMKKTNRVPNISAFFTWKIMDSEFGMKEALYDYKKLEKLVCDFHKRYQFDAYKDLGVRNPVKVIDALGSSFYTITDDGGINVHDNVIMQGDEYAEFVKDPAKFNWIKLMKRKYPEGDAKKLADSIWNFMMFGQFAQKMTNKFVKEYECPSVFDMMAVALHPFEFFFQTARGIKEISRDLRKNKEGLIEAMEAVYENSMKPSLEASLVKDTSAYVCDTYIALLAHSTLSNQQFEEIYWPILKRVFDKVVAANKTMYVYCESTILRFAELFQEIPKGHLVIHLENDDIFEARKQLPNVCLAGGMTTDLLGYGTPQECVDYAKKLIDEPGNGYIFSQNKMVSFKTDCKRENLLTVNDFVRNYRV